VSDRRLHRSAIGAEALDGLRQLALPILVVAVLGGGLSGEALVRAIGFGLAGLVFSVIVATVQWQSTSWRLDGESVRLRRGVLSESITTIPLERVQAVDTVRGPVQRLFGAVELHVQSRAAASRARSCSRPWRPPRPTSCARRCGRQRRGRRGRGPRRAARRVARAARRPGRRTGRRPPCAPRGSCAPGRCSSRRSRRGRSACSSRSSPRAARSSTTSRREDAERLVPTTLMDVAILAGAVLAFAWVLSVLGTIVAFAGFAVAREGERLRIRRGIIERREASVPVARVHAIRVIESPLREPLGFAQVRVETAGYADEPSTAQTLLPLVRRSQVARVLADLLPELELPPEALTHLEPPPRRALRRQLAAPVALALAAAAALTAVLGAPGAPAFALLRPRGRARRRPAPRGRLAAGRRPRRPALAALRADDLRRRRAPPAGRPVLGHRAAAPRPARDAARRRLLRARAARRGSRAAHGRRPPRAARHGDDPPLAHRTSIAQRRAQVQGRSPQNETRASSSCAQRTEVDARSSSFALSTRAGRRSAVRVTVQTPDGVSLTGHSMHWPERV
jgi:putative membrane protein